MTGTRIEQVLGIITCLNSRLFIDWDKDRAGIIIVAYR